jgi:uncharacterized protein
MQQSVQDQIPSMNEALTAIRRAIGEREVGKTTLVPAEELTSGEGAKVDAELLSREATIAISSAIGTLTETVKKHEPSLEDVVRETLRPMLNSWLDENLPGLVERMVRAEIERAIRGR